MTIDDVKKELERGARLTGKDIFVDAYKIITEQEKKIDQLNLDLESEKYRVERLKEELADKDLLVEQLQKSSAASFERLKRQQAEIERLKDENCELTEKLKARLTCDFVKTAQKQAVQEFIDELRNRCSEVKGYHYSFGNISGVIEELLEEVEND